MMRIAVTKGMRESSNQFSTQSQSAHPKTHAPHFQHKVSLKSVKLQLNRASQTLGPPRLDSWMPHQLTRAFDIYLRQQMLF